MTPASYNEIAQWYDQFLRERPVYMEVILPNLLLLLGEVEGEVICDLACGQGWVARELARRGAQVTGLDLAPNLLALARGYEAQEPLGIIYVQGDAQRAEPLGDRQFTGCVCVMALINIPDLHATFQSVRRILQPGGWFVFAIPHPCFETPHAQWVPLPDPEHPQGRLVTGYFDERVWGSPRTRTEFGAGLPTSTACWAPISTPSRLPGLCWNTSSNQVHQSAKRNECQATAKSPRSC
jgi:SAM-dependent methyltransferase